MSVNKSITMAELNSHFWGGDIVGINEEWLNETLVLELMNTEHLYKQRLNTRRKPESVAWEVLTFTANRILHDAYNGRYSVSSEHLKAWLNEEGEGYDTIKPLVDYIKAERENAEKGE